MIPRPVLARFPVCLLYNGPATGLLWCALLAGGTWLCAVCTPGVSRALPYFFVVYLYVLAATLVSMVLRRSLWPRTRPGTIFPVAICILALGTIVPVLAGVFLGSFHFSMYGAWFPGNLLDLARGSRMHNVDDHVAAGLIGVGFALMANVPWFVTQVRQYVPPQPVMRGHDAPQATHA